MELESPDGTTIPIDSEPSTVIGRGLGLGQSTSNSDRTVSRRHLSLCLLSPTVDDENTESGSESRVSFQVIGKNPILVCAACGRKQVYRGSEKGELIAGDHVSLSLKNPYFFLLKITQVGKAAAVDKSVLDAVERRERRTRERRKEKEQMEVSGGEVDDDVVAVGELDIELGSLDVSQIDPVKEFGFLVRGHEFDRYPVRKIRSTRNWNWFLEEAKGGSDDDEEAMGEPTSSKGKGRGRRKKKGDDNKDEVWTGESENEKELATEVGRFKRPRYSTRSKDPKKSHNDDLDGRKSGALKVKVLKKDEFEEEDKKDDTLGGFIVDGVEEEKEENEEEEMEEEEEEELEDEEVSDED